MSRAPNFAYDNPIADIGGSLARAIFGDPQAAAEQAKARAEAERLAAQAAQARAAAGYDVERTTGVRTQNQAAMSLPELIAKMSAPQAVAQPTMAVPEQLFAAPEISEPPMRAPEPQGDQQFAAALGPLLAAMGQMQGDKIDPSEMICTPASFLGGDALARRGMPAPQQSASRPHARHESGRARPASRQSNRSTRLSRSSSMREGWCPFRWRTVPVLPTDSPNSFLARNRNLHSRRSKCRQVEHPSAHIVIGIAFERQEF